MSVFRERGSLGKRKAYGESVSRLRTVRQRMMRARAYRICQESTDLGFEKSTIVCVLNVFWQ